MVNPADLDGYVWTGSVLYLKTPEVDGYGPTHITVCHFGHRYLPNNPEELLNFIVETAEKLHGHQDVAGVPPAA